MNATAAISAAGTGVQSAPGRTERLAEPRHPVTAGLADVAVMVMIALFAFEAAVRYGLNLVGLDALIYARDGILVLCLGALFIEAVLRQTGWLAFLAFGAAMALHGLVSLLTLSSAFAVIYGVKVLLTFLLGLVAWDRLVRPSATLRIAIAAVFIATVVGVVLDKFVLDFPWLGVTIWVGGVEMELGRQWWTEDERAGGFARSSIEIAQVAPLLCILTLGLTRNFLARAAIILIGAAVVFWTTQKGALLAFLLVTPWLLLPTALAARALAGAIWFMLFLMIGLPLLLPGYEMPAAAGVFSPMSFYMRIEEVWPDSFAWVARMGDPILGVGLGGIGGAQRFVAPDAYTPVDNMFLFFYAQFGLLGVVYLVAPAVLALVQRPAQGPQDLTGRALLAFIYGYGVVLTVIESQMGSMFLGVAVGALLAGARTPRAAPPVGARATEAEMPLGLRDWRAETLAALNAHRAAVTVTEESRHAR